MARRKDPPPIIEFMVDHEAEPIDFAGFLDCICAVVEALPDDVASLAIPEAREPRSA